MAYLSKRVANEIDGRGLKRRFIARKLGMTDNRFSLLINGRLQVRADEMLRLADLFDLEPEEIIQTDQVPA